MLSPQTEKFVIDWANRILMMAKQGDVRAFKEARKFGKELLKPVDSYEAYEFERNIDGWEGEYKYVDKDSAFTGLMNCMADAAARIIGRPVWKV